MCQGLVLDIAAVQKSLATKAQMLEDVMESPLRLTAHGGFGGGGEPDAHSAYANSTILQKGCLRSTSPAAYSTS